MAASGGSSFPTVSVGESLRSHEDLFRSTDPTLCVFAEPQLPEFKALSDFALKMIDISKRSSMWGGVPFSDRKVRKAVPGIAFTEKRAIVSLTGRSRLSLSSSGDTTRSISPVIDHSLRIAQLEHELTETHKQLRGLQIARLPYDIIFKELTEFKSLQLEKIYNVEAKRSQLIKELNEEKSSLNENQDSSHRALGPISHKNGLLIYEISEFTLPQMRSNLFRARVLQTSQEAEVRPLDAMIKKCSRKIAILQKTIASLLD